MEDPAAELIKITGGTGFDDVFCYAPVAQVVELSSAVLGRDGCLNFFAGPTDNKFSAKMNFMMFIITQLMLWERLVEIRMI